MAPTRRRMSKIKFHEKKNPTHILITYEALVKENALLAGKLPLDNSEQIKYCLGKNSKTFREIKHQQRERGRKRGREDGRRKGEGRREGRR